MSRAPRLASRPPDVREALARPRLDAACSRARVVVLTGGAGSGATTAAMQLAGGPVAWCRVVPGYDRAADVVAIAAASRGDEIEPAPRLLDLAEQLLDLVERDGCSIVVDDHHLIADPDVDRLLAEVAALLPSGRRIVVTSASRPAGLIGLVPARDLAVLDATDLAFDLAETTELLARGGGTGDDGARWFAATAGWPVAVAAAERDPSADADRPLTDLLVALVETTPESASAFDVAACVPYVTREVLATVDAAAVAPERLAATGALFTDHGTHVSMADAAATAWRRTLGADRVREIRRLAVEPVAATDPGAAIELALDADDPDAAADVLAAHLSEIGVDRALTWLYRLPPELRRRFPPVLAAGQATVEVDVALADAAERVDRAATAEERREALFGLGSVEAYRGELAAAATAFEAAMRAGVDDQAFRARVSAELATTRWLLGDLVGARAAMADAADVGPMRWLAAQLDAVEGLTGAADVEAHRRSDDDRLAELDAWTMASEALRSLVAGDVERARTFAADAYSSATADGGDVLAAAAAVHAWVALAEGRPADALVIADEFERRLGPKHRLGRVQGALVRERASRLAGDRRGHDRDVRRLRDLRSTGYATIEQLVDVVVPLTSGGAADVAPTGRAVEPPMPSLVVRVLGEHAVVVRGRIVGRGAWKSKKAFEVLTVMALGERSTRRERVIEDVWPGRDPEKGRTLLRTALSEIRRVLEPDRPAGEPSSFVETREDLVHLDGATDLDLAEAHLGDHAVWAHERLRQGLAPEVAAADWGHELAPRVERALLAAASTVARDEAAAHEQRVLALETLIAVEEWQRSHYDALAELHRGVGDVDAAADVERRWFADD